MSEAINWREMTSEQKNQLVHEKAMGNEPSDKIPDYTTSGDIWLVINRFNNSDLAREHLERLVGPDNPLTQEKICIAVLRACDVEVIYE